MLNGAGFAQVTHHGALVGPGFHAAVELRQGNDGTAQLFSQHFESTGNFAQLGGSVFIVGGGPTHELQIVHHNQAQFATAAGQAAGAGSELRSREACGFVNVQRNVAKFFNGFGQARPLFIGQLAGAQVALVDAPDGAHNTHGQLCGAHLHRKHRDGQPLVHGHMLGNIDGKRRFAHGRTRRQHHQVAALQT